MSRHLGKLEVKSVHEGEGRMPMQFAVPGVTGEDLSALQAWYWSDELSLDPQAAIFRIEVRSYLLNVDGLNVLVDTCCGNDKQRSVAGRIDCSRNGCKTSPAQAAILPISISCCARICTRITSGGIRGSRTDAGSRRFRTPVTCSAARTSNSLGGRRAKPTIERPTSIRCCRWSRPGLPTSWRAAIACIARSRTASGSRMRPVIRPAASS